MLIHDLLEAWLGSGRAFVDARCRFVPSRGRGDRWEGWPRRDETLLVPLRAAVELTFGWLVLHRRLARDYETLPTRSRTMILWGMIDN